MSFRLASAHSHGPHPLDAPRNWSHGPRRFARCPHIHSHRIPLPSWLHTNYNPRGPSNSWLHHNNSRGKYRQCPASYIHGSCILLGDAKNRIHGSSLPFGTTRCSPMSHVNYNHGSRLPLGILTPLKFLPARSSWEPFRRDLHGTGTLHVLTL